MGVSIVPAVLSGLAGIASAGDVLKDVTKVVPGVAEMAGELTGLATGSDATPADAVYDDAREDEQFLDYVALKISASPVFADKIFSIYKANREALRSPKNIARLTEWGLIVGDGNEDDDKFIDEIALEISASPVPAERVISLWKANRKGVRLPDNLALFKEWGVI